MSQSSFKYNKNRVLLHVDKCGPQTLGDILMILPFPKNIQPYIFLHKVPTRLIYCCTDGQKSPAKCSSSTSCSLLCYWTTYFGFLPFRVSHWTHGIWQGARGLPLRLRKKFSRSEYQSESRERDREREKEGGRTETRKQPAIIKISLRTAFLLPRHWLQRDMASHLSKSLKLLR